ncbi:MAG: tripartite tricarboxylate transporter permease [Anaerolineae bacterium]|nr:tripartite tricarboxylate transporter permease [Anaerolineae bacterium]
MNELALMLYALAGTTLASLLACVPALHVYNVAALILLMPHLGRWLQPHELAMLFLGMIVGYAVVNSIPSLFFAAPDESAVWIVLPGQRYLIQGRGYEAAVLTGVGGLGGVLVLVVLAPFAARLLAPIQQVIQPHLHWLLGLVVAYMLLSEWPKGSGRGDTALARLWDGWKSLLAGLATFCLSGMLGLIMMYRSPIPLEVSFQGMMPAFVGLFAIPWVLQNIVSGVRIPKQYICRSVDATPGLIARGVGAGVAGGLLAAFFPLVTGGIGGFIAGHATAQRDDRLFIVSQGASKAVYYAGALLFFFAPGLHLTRGGMAWMLSPLYTPYTPTEYGLAVAALALCGALAFFLLLGLSRAAIVLVERVDYRWLSGAALVLLLGFVVGMTGWGGLVVAAAATGIGLIPALFHSRRMYCMGVLLLPVLLNMAGVGSTVAVLFGLV